MEILAISYNKPAGLRVFIFYFPDFNIRWKNKYDHVIIKGKYPSSLTFSPYKLTLGNVTDIGQPTCAKRGITDLFHDSDKMTLDIIWV